MKPINSIRSNCQHCLLFPRLLAYQEHYIWEFLVWWNEAWKTNRIVSKDSRFIESLIVKRQLLLPVSSIILLFDWFVTCGCVDYSKYAEILAAQGCLDTAMGYLMAVNDQVRWACCFILARKCISFLFFIRNLNLSVRKKHFYIFFSITFQSIIANKLWNKKT